MRGLEQTMIDQYFEKPHVRRRLKRGPMAEIAPDYLKQMEMLGYGKQTIQQYVQAVEHFAGWLEKRGERLDRADATRVGTFLTRHLPHCQCPALRNRSLPTVRAALYQLLDVLDVDRREPKRAASSRSYDCVVDDFERYLVDVCGAATATRRYYVREARALFAMKFGDGEVTLTALRPNDMRAFVDERARSLSPRSSNVIATAVRSLIRYLRLRGIASDAWLAAVPRAASWRLAHLPRALTDDEVEAFVRSFDRKSERGRRDYAMALCFLRLGLRACEVAGLTVDDVNWRAGVVTISPGKTRRGKTLPLPNSVARALAEYLRHGRPKTLERALFVHHRPPRGQRVSASAVRSAVRQAYARAKIDSRLTGTHILRHTAATRLLRAGVSMKEIADILGHRSIDTSAIYAKVDIDALAAVALPWIEVQS
jgi:integrase/recombinase XerD